MVDAWRSTVPHSVPAAVTACAVADVVPDEAANHCQQISQESPAGRLERLTGRRLASYAVKIPRNPRLGKPMRGIVEMAVY
jgi:hypothetical protein